MSQEDAKQGDANSNYYKHVGYLTRMSRKSRRRKLAVTYHERRYLSRLHKNCPGLKHGEGRIIQTPKIYMTPSLDRASGFMIETANQDNSGVYFGCCLLV